MSVFWERNGFAGKVFFLVLVVMPGISALEEVLLKNSPEKLLLILVLRIQKKRKNCSAN
ncbi:MAG: hypothetical protein IFNCLDLE_01000 [Ignavibacteriaceae bacterium]|jgi:hypothetical protein|nr:hypothetical protein [Ignavibacteriaceae bacterium]